MTAATDVELDQQTRDELQPPCEIATWILFFGLVIGKKDECQTPAALIVRATCECGPTTHLTCSPHSRDIGTCLRCRKPITIVSTEPI